MASIRHAYNRVDIHMNNVCAKVEYDWNEYEKRKCYVIPCTCNYTCKLMGKSCIVYCVNYTYLDVPVYMYVEYL